jgi:hypothetical protein
MQTASAEPQEILPLDRVPRRRPQRNGSQCNRKAACLRLQFVVLTVLEQASRNERKLTQPLSSSPSEVNRNAAM